MPAVQTSLVFSEWLSIVQTAAIVITGFAAVFTLHTSSKLSKHRATIELLLSQRTDERLIQATNHVSKIINDEQMSITSLACKGMEHDENRQHLLAVLNNYEFIAVGIREKALDEQVYKRAKYSNFMRDWRATKAFVMELRSQFNRPTLFQEFEFLYNKWLKKPLKEDNPH